MSAEPVEDDFQERLPPHAAAYQEWSNDPENSDKLHSVVKSLQPTISGVLRSIGSDQDPAVQLKAKILAGRAVKTYSPTGGAALHTWVARQLQPLRRYKRTTLTPVHVPERMQLDAVTIMHAENEFRDKHGREPSLTELSDQANMPIRRISDIKKTFRPVAAQSSFGESAPGGAVESDYSEEAMHYIYPTLERLDQKIIEMKTGFGGNYDAMPPNEVARRLNISPVQLTRRSARISAKVSEIRDALQKTTRG